MNLESIIQYSLHIISQDLLLPVMIILVALIILALVLIGSIIVEALTERRHFKANAARDINAIFDASYDAVIPVIAGSGMLEPQKDALITVASNMGLSDANLFALAKAEVAKVNDRYQRILKRVDLISKIAPMVGLMGTLIPLGPGIVAMSSGDLETLSRALLVAFDTTVAGLVVSCVAMIVGNFRRRWYGTYLANLESLMAAIMDKAEQARKDGVVLPHNFTNKELKQSRKYGLANNPEEGHTHEA